MIRVAVVDDQELIRDGLHGMLTRETNIHVALQVSHGQELLDALQSGIALDVVLLDLRMPVLDGIATLEQLARHGHRPRVLVVTTFDRDDLVLDAIAAGADGYILKRASRHDLVTAITAVASGASVLSPDVTRAVMNRVRQQPPQSPTALSNLGLTTRETDILTLVGTGLSNDAIAAHLTLSVHTVKTHLTSILRKTGCRDRTQAAILAIRAGLA